MIEIQSRDGCLLAVIAAGTLAGANLSRVRWPGADLHGADLHQANLWHADLRGADLSNARLNGDAEYALCLGYGAFAIRDLLQQVEPSLILGKSEVLGVVVGFDDGDSMLVGEFGPSGLAAPAHSDG
jgi:hypothetical protein